jgi:hypothetical protein
MAMRKLLIFALITVGSPAAADTIRVKNTGTTPIYKLYAWPSDFGPRSISLVMSPIFPGESKDIDVENDWSKCDFTIQTDRNDPAKKKRVRRKLPFGVAETNICGDSTSGINLGN